MRKLEVDSIESIRSISSQSLESVDNIRLSTLPNIVYLNFSALSVLEEVWLDNLPIIENCSLGMGPRTKASILNTGLQKIDWLKWPITTTLNITGNTNLDSLSLPWDIISANVTMRNNAVLRNMSASGVNSVTGSFMIRGSDEMEEFTLENLETVDGELNLSGAFTNISMPVLKSVKGILKLESSRNISKICNGLAQEKLKGQLECKTDSRKEYPDGPTSEPFNKTSDNPAQSSGSSPKDQQQPAETDMALGAKIGVILASLILAIFVFVGVFFFVRARIRGKVMEIVPTAPATPMMVSKPEQPVVIQKSGESAVRVVKINLNGQEVEEKETDKAVTAKENMSVGKEIVRELSLRSVSSMGSAGSEVRMMGGRYPRSPVSPV